jgi:hypothetical protein
MEGFFQTGTSFAAMVFFNLTMVTLIGIIVAVYLFLGTDYDYVLLAMATLAFVLLVAVDLIIIEVGLEGDGSRQTVQEDKKER